MRTKVRFYLSYDTKIALKLLFFVKYAKILSLCTQHCFGRHDITLLKYVNHIVLYQCHTMKKKMIFRISFHHYQSKEYMLSSL